MSEADPRPTENVGRRLARRSDGVLVRRWGGAWIDFIAVGAIAVGTIAALSEQMALIALLLAFGLSLTYFTVTEGVWGRSLGKLITGTIVVDASGRPPGVGRAFVRTLLRLVEVNPFLLGGIPASICVWMTKDQQRIGDLLAGTYVVRASALASARTQSPSPTVFD
jgi:uncharacterized RDD family membrane protein YckC